MDFEGEINKLSSHGAISFVVSFGFLCTAQ